MGMLKRINYYQDRSGFRMERAMLLKRQTQYEKKSIFFLIPAQWKN